MCSRRSGVLVYGEVGTDSVPTFIPTISWDGNEPQSTVRASNTEGGRVIQPNLERYEIARNDVLAEAVRFELTNRFPRRQFSRLVPSTARPRFLQTSIIQKTPPAGSADSSAVRQPTLANAAAPSGLKCRKSLKRCRNRHRRKIQAARSRPQRGRVLAEPIGEIVENGANTALSKMCGQGTRHVLDLALTPCTMARDATGTTNPYLEVDA